MCTTVSLGAGARWNGADISTRSFVSRRSRDPEGEVGRRFEGGHPIATSMRSRAALTGKHDTLVRRAPGWQGPPTASRQKKLVVTKCLFHIINVLI